MDDLDYKLYVLAELNYKKTFSNIKEDDLYPLDFYSFNDYKLKTEIIAQAIKEKKLIKDTSRYKKLVSSERNSH